MPDAELVQRYRATGDPAFVGVLFERYTIQIYAVCKGFMKEEEQTRDAAMEMYEYLLSELRKYPVENFRNWLGRACRNFCLMRLRKESTAGKRRNEWEKDEKAVMDFPAGAHLMEEEGHVNEQQLHAALQSLNEKQRMCVELFYLQDLSYDEVAKQTGFSMNEVKSHIQNGKRNLRIRLEDKK